MLADPIAGVGPMGAQLAAMYPGLEFREPRDVRDARRRRRPLARRPAPHRRPHARAHAGLGGVLARPPRTTQPFLLAGDTLFQGGIGRTDLPGGSTEEMLASLRDKSSSAWTTTPPSCPATARRPRWAASATPTPTSRACRAPRVVTCERGRPVRRVPRAQGHPRVRRAREFTTVRDTLVRAADRAGYAPRRAARLRGDRALRPRRGRVHRRRHEGDVLLRRPRRPLGDAAPRGHRGRRARRSSSTASTAAPCR